MRDSAALTAAVREEPPPLASIQATVGDRLDQVMDEIQRIVVTDFALIEEVNEYLLMVRGKLFRPTALLLSSEVGSSAHPRAVTLAAVVELVHLATLVHDDAVDHSVMRRGLPTVNALWTHQIAIIMGDYLYSRSVTELAQLGDLEAVQVLARAANEMSMGEMRQLRALARCRRHTALHRIQSFPGSWCRRGAPLGGGAQGKLVGGGAGFRHGKKREILFEKDQQMTCP